jgi:endogenous inhibitor of DNA gyrase (YacG/DUF329 family)
MSAVNNILLWAPGSCEKLREKTLLKKKANPLKVRCPRCGKDTQLEGNPYRPFCSRRCKLIDLGRWVDEEYLIPGQEDEAEGELEREKN